MRLVNITVQKFRNFVDPQRIEIEGRVLERSADEVAASLYSLSSAAPHLFGDRFDAFDADVRQLLRRASPHGLFSEQLGAIALDVWR